MQMFVVKGSSDRAANRAPAEQVPSELSMDGACTRLKDVLEQDCSVAPVEIPTTWPAWAATALVNFTTVWDQFEVTLCMICERHYSVN